MTSARAARVARLGALGLALGVGGLGLYGLWFEATLARRLPSPLDWRAAAALLAREARPGDAVALAPAWAERAREVLPPMLPVLAFPRLAGEDLVGVERVWLVALPSAPGYRAADRDGLVARAAALEGPLALGALEVTRIDLRAPTLPLAFLPDRLEAAEVTEGGAPCAARPGGGFECPSGAGVAREVREVDLLPRPCISGSTGGDPARPIAIAFRGVRLGKRLRGHAGVVGEAALEPDGALRVEVAVDGRHAASLEVAGGDVRWHAFEADTAREAGRAAAVTFTVSDTAAGDPRPFCLDAYALP
ncbi:MAG: hypothetical protein ACJ79E_09425 [Anaeromyxobacteraceae bacterium]